MASSVLKLNNFGGLDLLTNPDQIGAGGAVAMSNVALDVPGQIRTRSGYFKFATTTTAPYRAHTYINNNTGVTRYVTSSPSKLEAFDEFGGAVASVAATGPHAMVTYGGSAIAPVVYTVSAFDASVRKFNGTVWSVVAGVTQARAITQDTDSGRLVLAGESGTSRVRFSDPGAPETFATNNYVDLEPGDGNYITAAACWQGLVFVFTQSRFFIFYGESVDSSGNPTFLYRTIEGVGARATNAAAAAVATPQGVFFIGADGIYLTTGGAPVLVSRSLRPLFVGPNAPTMTSALSIGWSMGRLFVTLTSLSSVRVFVWYSTTDSWVEWSTMTGKGGGGFHGNDELGDRVVFVNGTDLALYAMTPACITDAETSAGASDGTAVSWSYQTGRYQPANGNEAVVQETSLVGSGTVTAAIVSDLFASQSASATLGAAPAVAEGFPTPLDQQGTWLQTTLSGTGTAAVTEVRHHIGFVRGASNAR